MLPSDHDEFVELVTKALAGYARRPSADDLEDWWDKCHRLSLEGLRAAFKAHEDDPERGERAPRPVDITRRMKAGSSDALRCAARDTTGQCEYPGIFNEGTNGEGRWWCPWHRLDHAGPEASRWIEVSRQVPYAEAMAKRQARMHNDAIRSSGVVERAWDIAKRHGARAWQVGERWHLPHVRREAAD